MNISDMEDTNRNRLLDIVQRIPAGIPDGWEKTTYAVGGLMYVGSSMCALRNWLSYHPRAKA